MLLNKVTLKRLLCVKVGWGIEIQRINEMHELPPLLYIIFYISVGSRPHESNMEKQHKDLEKKQQ